MTLDTMTVGELKALLTEFPDSKRVGFAYPSGDHWRTRLVGTIKSAELVKVQYTGYHQAFQLVEEDESPGSAAQDEVLVLG